MPVQLRSQLQQPGPAIGPLEPRAQRPVEVGQLARHFVVGELAIQQRANGPGFGALGEEPQQPRQQPVPVYAGVPVETAVEDRVQLARRRPVLVGAQHLVELERIVPLHMPQRDAGEAVGQLRGQA